MTKKEFLNQAFFLDRRIQSKERQLAALRAHAVYTTPQIDEAVVTSPSVKSHMEETAVKIIELEEVIASQIAELLELKKMIAEVIRGVGNVEYETLLEMRYLSFMDWKEIAARLGYSGKYVFEVHGRALHLVTIPDRVL